MSRLDYMLLLLLFIAISVIASIKAYELIRVNNRLMAQMKQTKEKIDLERKGHIVAMLDVQKAINNKAKKIESLKNAIKKVRKDAKKVKIVRVLEASTGPIEPIKNVSESASKGKCLIRLGDKLKLSVKEIDLKTVAGNYIVKGNIELHRLLPAPEQLIASGEFVQKKTRLSIVNEPAKQQLPWWAHELIGVGIGIFAYSLADRL